MSRKYEWHSAQGTNVAWVPGGHDVNGEVASQETPDEFLVEDGALVISTDEASVIHGTPSQVYEVLDRAIRALPWKYELKDQHERGWGVWDTRSEACDEAIRLGLHTFTVEETLVDPDPDAGEPSCDAINENIWNK